jgi:ketosteroid isomerase-like protein
MHANEALARREIEALNANDLDAVRALYTDDFVLHYPGKNPLAGDHRSFSDFLAKVRELMGKEATVTRELHDALGNDEHAIQLLNVTANVKGKKHTWHSVIVIHPRDGKIAEAWIHIDKQDALDAFLNSLV